MLPGTEEKQIPAAQGSMLLGQRLKSLWGREGLLAQGLTGKCINIADAVGLQSSVLRLF